MLDAMIKAIALLLALAGIFTVSPALAQDVAAGEKQIAMCIGCHGIPRYQASFPEVHKVPMISGQNAAYIVASLRAYKNGDRRHPTMQAISATLSDQAMADIAAYYEQHGRSSLKTVAAGTVRAPSAAVAELLNRGACVSCHGADYNKPIDPSYPKLAGQHADYLYVALKSYQTTGNSKVGRNNPIMMGVAGQFKPAELKAMAQYLASLPAEVRTVPQGRFK
jgi:cytochrome c553